MATLIAMLPGVSSGNTSAGQSVLPSPDTPEPWLHAGERSLSGESADSQPLEPGGERPPAAGSVDRYASNSPEPEAGTITISPEDNLSTIAQQIRPDESLSLQQTMLAIQRLNPEAFIDGDINRLRSDLPLRVPSRAQIEAVDPLEASAYVARQYQEFAGLQVPVQDPGADTDLPREQPGAPAEVATQQLPADDDTAIAVLERRIAELENRLLSQQEEADRSRRERQQLQSTVATLNQQVAAAEAVVSSRERELAELQESIDTPARADAGASASTDAAPQSRRSDAGRGIPAFPDGNWIMIAVAVTVAILLATALLMRRGRNSRVAVAGVAPGPGPIAAGPGTTVSSAGEGRDQQAADSGPVRTATPAATESKPTAAEPKESPAADAAGSSTAGAGLYDNALLSGEDEAATKLELAYAYQRMGNAEDARELLKEVIDEGSAEQASEARTLLASLD